MTPSLRRRLRMKASAFAVSVCAACAACAVCAASTVLGVALAADGDEARASEAHRKALSAPEGAVDRDAVTRELGDTR